MKEKEYELVIIGGGMAGLSTAISWCRTRNPIDHPVLVLEKEPAVGGCVTTFARKGWRFDTVQIIPEVGDLLGYFGLDCKLRRYTGNYARLFLVDPETRSKEIFSVPASGDDFRKSLAKQFPADQSRIDKFFDYGQGLLEELRHLKTEPTILQGLGILFRCPKIIRQSGRTYRQYLDSFGFRSLKLLEILDMFSSFSGLSGDRCAALLTACATMTTLEGCYRPADGFITFPRELRRRLEELGGEVRTGVNVDEILVDNGRVIGARAGEEEYRSDNVVCTADTIAAIRDGGILEPAHLKKAGRSYYRKLQKAQSSASSFTIHLGLDENIDLKNLGFDCGYNVLTTGRSAHEEAFRRWESGTYLRDEKQFHLAVISPSAITEGKPNLVIHVTPAAMAEWDALRDEKREEYDSKKRDFADWYIDKVEEYMIPNLREHIRLVDVATPATYRHYLGSAGGANSDMLSVPSNFGMHRLRSRTPIKGLFLPKFSHGIWPSLQAGLQTVDMITGGEVMAGNSRYVGN